MKKKLRHAKAAIAKYEGQNKEINDTVCDLKNKNGLFENAIRTKIGEIEELKEEISFKCAKIENQEQEINQLKANIEYQKREMKRVSQENQEQRNKPQNRESICIIHVTSF